MELKGVNIGGGKRKVASTMTLPRDVISLRRAPGFLFRVGLPSLPPWYP